MTTKTERRLIKACIGEQKSRERLIKAKTFRIWVERNPNINLLNYPIRKILDRKDIRLVENEVRRSFE